MTRYSAYLTKMNQKKRRFVSLSQCVLGDKPYQYIWYRLRFFSLKLLLSTSLHAVEFVFIFIIFSYHIAASILLFRILAYILTGSWWGLLESMRERVRILVKTKQNTLIGKTIVAWLYLSMFVGVLILLFSSGLIWSIFIHVVAGQWFLFDVYLAAILIQTLSRMIVLTYHSGIFSLKRVYRPLYSILLSPIVGICCIFALWPLLHGFSLPIAALAEAMLSMYFTWYFSSRMLAKQRIPIDFHWHRSLIVVAWQSIKNSGAFMAALSGLIVNVEGLLLLLIMTQKVMQHNAVFSTIYLLAPVIMGANTWTKLFYFDYKKQSQVLLRLIMNRLKMVIEKMTFPLVIFLWFLGSLLQYFINHETHLYFYISLFLFLFTRSLLCQVQIQYYAYRYFTPIIWNSVLIFMLAFILSFSLTSITSAFIYLSVLQFIIYLLLKYCVKFQSTRQARTDEVYFYPWICGFRQRIKTGLLNIISLKSEVTVKQAKQVVANINTETGAFGGAHYIKKNTIYYYIVPSADTYKQKVEVAINTLGRLVEIRTEYFTINRHLNINKENHLLELWQDKPTLEIKHIIAKFKELFSEGIILDFENNVRDGAREIDSAQWAKIWTGLQIYLQSPEDRQFSAYYVSALCKECVEIVFIIPKDSNSNKMAQEWLDAVHYLNLKALLK